jgi:hypothetical protein
LVAEKLMKTVPTKAIFYRLYEQGAFGNKPLTFASMDDLLASGFTGKVGLRYGGKMPGAQYPKYCESVTVPEAVALAALWETLGADKACISCIAAQGIDDECVLMQGEVQRSEYGLLLYYSTERARMRPALAKSGQQVHGLTAQILLKRHLWPTSYDDVMELLDEYPSSVIECTAYSQAVGNCRNRNTIIWEVRNY